MFQSLTRLLAATFVALLLAACGGGTDDGQPPASEPDVGGPMGRSATFSVSGGGDRVESPSHRAIFFIGTPAVSSLAPAAAHSMGLGPARRAQTVIPSQENP